MSVEDKSNDGLTSKPIQEQTTAIAGGQGGDTSQDRAAIPISRISLVGSFIVLYMLFLWDFAARVGVTAIFPAMQKDLGLTDGQIGMIGSCVLLGMTVFVLPFSFLADKTRKRAAVSAMGLIWGVGSILSGLATTFLPLLFGRFFVGMGNAAYAPVSVSMLTSWIRPSRWGTALGLYNSAMSSGVAVGTMLSGYMVVIYGWRAVFYLIGGISVFFAVLVLFLPRSTHRKKTVAVADRVTLKEAVNVTLKNKTVVLLGLAVGFSNMVIGAGIVWLPAFLIRYMGWDSKQVGTKLGLMYLLLGLSVFPLSGIIADKLGKWDRRTRAWFGVPCVLISGILAVAAFVNGSFWFIIAYQIFLPMPISAIHSATQELVPAKYKASSYGTYVVLIQGLGILGPSVAGFLSDFFELQKALIYIQSGLLITSVLLLAAGFTYMVDYNKARAMEKEAAA